MYRFATYNNVTVVTCNVFLPYVISERCRMLKFPLERSFIINSQSLRKGESYRYFHTVFIFLLFGCNLLSWRDLTERCCAL